MSNDETNGVQAQQQSDVEMASPEKAARDNVTSKGKGKAAEENPAMDESEEDSEEEQGDGEAEEADEDNMEEIDMDNIVQSRTRGKNIDYAEAAKQLDDDEEDDEDDEDFEDDGEDKMEE